MGDNVEALVFADRVGNELLPLTQGLPMALLPVNGKPLLGHTLEDLADADISSAMVVVGDDQAAAIEREVGDGGRWGVELDFVRARTGETPTQLARRFANRLPDSFLAMRGDVYRRQSVRSFRAAANNVLAKQVIAQIDGRNAQLCLCRQRDAHLDLLSWAPARQARSANWRTIEIDDGEFCHLFDTTEFYLANIDGLDNRVATLNEANGLPGRRLFAGPDDGLRPEVVLDGPVLIGSGCEIGQDVRLAGPLVIGNDVYIDDSAFLHACVLLPGTYVPPGTRLHNAVVTSEIAIGIAGDVICRFADRLDARSGT